MWSLNATGSMPMPDDDTTGKHLHATTHPCLWSHAISLFFMHCNRLLVFKLICESSMSCTFVHADEIFFWGHKIIIWKRKIEKFMHKLRYRRVSYNINSIKTVLAIGLCGSKPHQFPFTTLIHFGRKITKKQDASRCIGIIIHLICSYRYLHRKKSVWRKTMRLVWWFLKNSFSIFSPLKKVQCVNKTFETNLEC